MLSSLLRTCLLLPLVLSAQAQAAAQNYTLSHRFLSPSTNTPAPFTPRGTITVHPGDQPWATYAEDEAIANEVDDGTGMYQVALGTEGETDFIMASTRAVSVSAWRVRPGHAPLASTQLSYGNPRPPS
jgi:hypothetical protein